MEELSYTSKFDGETTDDILGYANEGKTEKVNEYVKSMNVQDSKGEPDTVQVYDTDGVPHKISKTELLKKSTLALPALEDISSFVAVNAAGNAVGVMTKEQVASVLAELMRIQDLRAAFNFKVLRLKNGETGEIGNINGLLVITHTWVSATPAIIWVCSFNRAYGQVSGNTFDQMQLSVSWEGEREATIMKITSNYSATSAATEFYIAYQNVIGS